LNDGVGILHKPVNTDDPFLWGRKKEDACKSKLKIAGKNQHSQPPSEDFTLDFRVSLLYLTLDPDGGSGGTDSSSTLV